MKYDLDSIRENGYKYIIPARKEEWDALCDEHINVSNPSLSMLHQVVAIMKELSSTPMRPYFLITKLANEEISHSSMSWSWVVKNVAYYHPKGVDYAIKGSEIFLGSEDKKQLSEIDEENKKLENKKTR